MVRKGIAFSHWDRDIEKYSFFKGIKLLYFTDVSFGNFLLHTHDNLEIILVLDGDVEMLIDGMRYPVPRGSLISIPPALIHHTIVPEHTKQYERMVLHIFPEYLDSLAQNFGLEKHRFDFCRQVQVLDYSPDTLWLFRTIFERAHYANSQDEEYRDLVIPCLMIELFMELELRLKAQKTPPLPVSNNLASAVVDYLDEHFTEPGLTMEQIQKAVYVSQGYMSRVFKSYTGSSIYNYLTYKRLTYAKELLAAGSTVLDACVACGFTDYTSFLKVFKKAFSQTPSQYKKQMDQRHLPSSP